MTMIVTLCLYFQTQKEKNDVTDWWDDRTLPDRKDSVFNRYSKTNDRNEVPTSETHHHSTSLYVAINRLRGVWGCCKSLAPCNVKVGIHYEYQNIMSCYYVLR